MVIRALPAAVSMSLLAIACGSSGTRTDPAPVAPVADEPLPADAPELGIDEVDAFRWILSEKAVLELAINAASGAIEHTMTPAGLELASFPPGGVLHQCGFRRGDLIVTIDGAPPAELAETYRRARSTGAVDVELTRGAERLQRTFYLADETQLVRRADNVPPDPVVTDLVAAIETGVKQTRADRFELHYDVDRLVLQSLADNPGIVELVTTALGLTPYDALQSLDQHPVRSTRSLGRALAELGPARSFSLSIIRVTTPLVIRFRVVDDVVMDAQLASAVERWNAENKRADDPVVMRRPSLDPDDPLAHPDYSGIEKIAEDHFVIPRHLLASIGDPAVRAARFVPSMKDGAIDGIKVYGVRRNSLPSLAGIRNGDNIRSVGGTPVDSIDGLTAALAAAAKRSSLVLEIGRRGRDVTLTYDLR